MTFDIQNTERFNSASFQGHCFVYRKGDGSMTKEQIIKERFPNSKIYRLQAERKRTKKQKILDHLTFIFTDAPAGLFESKNFLSDAGREFYLIQHDMHYYLAAVSGETVESQSIDESLVADEFECGGWEFKNKGLIV